MRAYFYWEHCDLGPDNARGHGRALFWVGAKLEEINREWLGPNQHILDEVLKQPSWELDDSWYIDGRMFFMAPSWLAKDDAYQSWWPMFRIYPYSGMWNGCRPWIAIGPPKKDDLLGEPEGYEFTDIRALDCLDKVIKNRGHIVVPEFKVCP
jgi:hypothetical protein